jgi:uncharacterized membrane protein YjgN (DUF898 family)
MNVVPTVPFAPPDLGRQQRLSFTGDGAAFLRLLIRGSLLMVPTLGFYRFWLVTDVRRHLWGHTRIDGEALEYTGTARELLVGFLIALAILAPLYVAYFILGLLAEELQAFASIPLVLVLYVFGQYATFRARRYRLTRTAFRGVRFWMTGSAWSYAGRAALWDVLTLLSLGLAYPGGRRRWSASRCATPASATLRAVSTGAAAPCSGAASGFGSPRSAFR